VGAHPTDQARSKAVAIVTGASRGAGRQIARQLARRDYAIVVVYLRDQREAEAAVDEILGAGATAVAVRADLTDELDVERLFTETDAAFGGVDVVVHTTIRGAALVNRNAASQLRHGGAIVSVLHADGITDDVARQLRERGVTVNGRTAGLEAPSRNRDVAEVLAVLDRWHDGPEVLDPRGDPAARARVRRR
jgi:3-oxoacyl-[acyl-carrier protein] reductase